MKVNVLRTPASRTVLVMLLGIAALELGISGKLAQLWTLAFTGKAGATSAATPKGA